MKNSAKNSFLFTGLFILGIFLSTSFTSNAISNATFDGDDVYELKCDGKTTEAKSKEAKTGAVVKSEKKATTTESKCGEGKCGEAKSSEAKTGTAVQSEKKATTSEGKCGTSKE